MDLDFTDFKSEEKIIHFMLIAISVLKKHINQQVFLFDDVGERKIGRCNGERGQSISGRDKAIFISCNGGAA